MKLKQSSNSSSSSNNSSIARSARSARKLNKWDLMIVIGVTIILCHTSGRLFSSSTTTTRIALQTTNNKLEETYPVMLIADDSNVGTTASHHHPPAWSSSSISSSSTSSTASKTHPPLAILQSPVGENSDRSDARPRGMRLAFMGDSMIRFQYVSFAYFLRTGTWWDPAKKRPYHLVHDKLYENWETMFTEQTSKLFYPYERCDCYRPDGESKIIIENRYFYEPERDNMLVFISAFGHTQPAPHGRVKADEAMVDIPKFKFVHEYNNTIPWEWQYDDWGDLIREHLGRLDPKPTHIMLNAGLHPHNFTTNSTLRTNLKQAIDDAGMLSIWKTTSYWRLRGPHPGANVTDRTMCALFDRCLDVTWSNCVLTKMQYDRLHFVEPVYRIFNEDLLELMGHTWPDNYTKIDRMTLLRPDRTLCFVLPGQDIWNMTPNRFEWIPHTESLYWYIYT